MEVLGIAYARSFKIRQDPVKRFKAFVRNRRYARNRLTIHRTSWFLKASYSVLILHYLTHVPQYDRGTVRMIYSIGVVLERTQGGNGISWQIDTLRK